MGQFLRVRVSSIRPGGEVSVGGQLMASFGPARTDDLQIGDEIEVEIDHDDYPISAQKLDGEEIWSDTDISR